MRLLEGFSPHILPHEPSPLTPPQEPPPHSTIRVRIPVRPLVPRRPLQRLLIPNDYQRVPRAREGDVEPPPVGEEPDGAVPIGPDGGEENDAFLPSLEAVDGVYFDLGDFGRSRGTEQRAELGRRKARLESVDEKAGLGVIRRDDADVVSCEGRVAVEQVAHNLDEEVHFLTVETRLAVHSFGALVRDESDGDGVGRGGRWGGSG